VSEVFTEEEARAKQMCKLFNKVKELEEEKVGSAP
jgi:hypothetical protein